MNAGVKVGDNEELHVFDTRLKLDSWCCEDLEHHRPYDSENESHKKIMLKTIKDPNCLVRHYVVSNN